MNPYSLLLSDCRQWLGADAFLADVPIIVEGEGRAIAVATRIRDAGIATLEFTAPHKLKNHGRIRVEDMGDETFAAENVELTVVDATKISYASPGDNQAATAEATGIVTPLLIPIEEAVEKGLAQGGLLRGATNKGGLAILLMVHRGSPRDRELPTAQYAQIRATVFCDPILNAGGLKKPQMDVLCAVLKRLADWDRGAGADKPWFLGWDSRESADGKIALFGDFNVFHLFT